MNENAHCVTVCVVCENGVDMCSVVNAIVTQLLTIVDRSIPQSPAQLKWCVCGENGGTHISR